MTATPKLVIVNADDLGASRGVNDGIVEAVEAGIVTSASLMVNMPAAADAVERLAHVPAISIGIHVNFTDESLPALVDFDDPSACGRELSGQLDTFVRLTGVTPTHVDAHHNVHRDPRLTPMFVDAARGLGVPLRENGPVEYFPSFYGQWDGETHPEHISVDNLLTMVEGFGPGPTELACHPGRPEPEFVSTYHRERSLELETLLSPRLIDALTARGVRLTSYHEMASWR